MNLDAVKPDGNCLFRSISKSLTGSEANHARYRDQAVQYMTQNRPDFEWFIEDDEPWDDYIERIAENAEWGGNLELKALSDVLRVSFVIHQLDAPLFVMQCTGVAEKTVHLAYSGQAHYDSVRHVSDTNSQGKPAMSFQFAGIPTSGDAGGGDRDRGNGSSESGAGGKGKPKPISAVERRVMEGTGCPHLEYIRLMLNRFNGAANLVIEEMCVQGAMAEYDWDLVIRQWQDSGSQGGQTSTPASASRSNQSINQSQTPGGGDLDVNYIKNVENVKMIAGCPSFELSRRFYEENGRNVGAAVQELQTLFICGGEKWPMEEELRAADADWEDDDNDDNEPVVEMRLVDESASKNMAFWFSVCSQVAPVPPELDSGSGSESESEQTPIVPRVWRRIDLRQAKRPQPKSVWSFRQADANAPELQPVDDEQEVYGRESGTVHYEVLQMVHEDGGSAASGDDGGHGDGTGDHNSGIVVDVVVPWQPEVPEVPEQNNASGVKQHPGSIQKASRNRITLP